MRRESLEVPVEGTDSLSRSDCLKGEDRIHEVDVLGSSKLDPLNQKVAVFDFDTISDKRGIKLSAMSPSECR